MCVCVLNRLCQQRRKKSATYKLCLFIYYIFETAALNYATFCPKLSPLLLLLLSSQDTLCSVPASFWCNNAFAFAALLLNVFSVSFFHKSGERKMKKYVLQMLLTADSDGRQRTKDSGTKDSGMRKVGQGTNDSRRAAQLAQLAI